MPGNEPAGVAAGRSATGGCAIAVSSRAALSGRLPAVLTALTVRRACVRPMCREARCGGRDGPPLAGPSALPATHADRSCWKQRAADSPPRTNRHGSIDAAHLHLLCRVHRHGHRLRRDAARRCPRAGRDRQRGQAAPESAQPSPSATAEAQAREITITAFDLGFEPAMVDVPEPGTYTVTFVNDGGVAARRHLRRWDQDRGRGARDRHGRGDRAGRRHDLHLLGPRALRRRDDRRGDGRDGRRLRRAGPVAWRRTHGRRDAGQRRRHHGPVPCRDRGPRQPGPGARDPRRRHAAVGADGIGHPVGDRAGHLRRGVRLQRHGAGAAAPSGGWRQDPDHPSQRAARAHHDPLARPVRSTRHGWRAGHQPAGRHAGRVVHLRVHAPQRRLAHVPQPLHGRDAGADGPAGRLRRDRSERHR